jgi:protein involved in polysaccharide export with SLBB domain
MKLASISSARCSAMSVLILFLAGCGSNLPPVSTIPAPSEWHPPSPGDVVIHPGDVLQVSYFKSVAKDSLYRLEIGDHVRLSVESGRTRDAYTLNVDDQIQIVVKSGEVQGPYRILADGTCTLPLLGAVPLYGMTIEAARNELVSRYRRHYSDPTVDILVTASSNRQVNEDIFILQDGRCTLPIVGLVSLAGLTVPEATAAVTEKYQQYFREPKVELIVTTSRERATEFLSTLGRALGGSVREFVIQPDGVLELPLIKQIYPVGRTLIDVRGEIRDAYARAFPGIEVTTNLSSQHGRFVAVLGEVERGGLLELPAPLSLPASIALAGGFRNTAHRAQVLLIHPESDGALTVRVANLADALDMSDASVWALSVMPGDVVYVPKSAIAKVDQFVDQFIRQLIPIDIGVGIGIQYNAFQKK